MKTSFDSPVRRVFLLICIMATIVSVTVVLTLVLLYQTSIGQQKIHLLQSATSLARLIEAVSQFDQQHYEGSFAGGAREATFSQINQAIHQMRDWGSTGEVLLGEKKNEGILYLHVLRSENEPSQREVPLDSTFGEAMRRALQGETGTGIGLDYRGKTVLFAHVPITTLNMGIVVKRDLAEVRWPMIQTGIWSFGIAGIGIAVGSFFHYRISSPMINSLIEREELLNNLNAELEQRVRDRTSELAASNKELEAFCYSVSHDLRVPLRHINGFLKLLADHVEERLDVEARHYLEVVQRSASRLGTLIDDLLQFSRIGRTEMHKKKVDLSVLLHEVKEELKPEWENRHVTWLHDRLPVVTVDANMIRLVFLNLLSNALKYTSNRDHAVIQINHEVQGELGDVICIKDNGAGFDMRYVNKLFTVFQRLHTVEEFEGTGIGLTNVKRLITRHGGTCWAAGREDEGAAFYISFPKGGLN